MSDPLFYVERVPEVGAVAVVDGDEGFHAATVRRIRVGEHIALSDGLGEWADCVVSETAKRQLSAQVLERRTVQPPYPPVTIVQALPKADRSELAVELATEVGADGFLAWQAARCVARWDGPKVEKGVRRWGAVARSAARQSRRAFVPAVAGVLSTADLVDRVRAQHADQPGALVLALHESATLPLTDLDVGRATSIMLIVGPEGGISDQEIVALADAGAKAVRLGPTVLRTSTAAAVALGALGVLTSRWG